MNIIGICTLCIVAGVLSLLLKQYKPEYSMFISVSASCAVILIIGTQLGRITSFLDDTFDADVINGEYLSIMFKTAGICYISHFGSSICRDCGQTALAQQIELASRVSITLLALPVFTELIKVVSNISGG